MNIVKVFLLLLLSCSLFASEQLKSNYFIQNDFILLSDVVPNATKDSTLYTIDPSRHSKKVKSKDLLKTLKKLGYADFTSKNNYVQFSKKSPINTDTIELNVRNRYAQKYKNIDIQEIVITPRSYIETIPKEYSVVIKRKAHLKKDGHLYIKTADNKKIFFNYYVKAKITVFKAKVNLKREDELSNLNIKKNSIMLEKFRAMPLQEIPKFTYQAKRKIKEGTVLTIRDVKALNIVRRNANVNVVIKDSNIAVSFIAKASQNGKFGQTITVENRQGKKFKVIVTGRNSAEIR